MRKLGGNPSRHVQHINTTQMERHVNTNINTNINTNTAQKQSVAINLSSTIGTLHIANLTAGPGPSFTLPLGTPPIGIDNGSVFTLLLDPKCDTSWVEQSSSKSSASSSTARLWERFLALQQRGAYVLDLQEIERTKSSLQAYMLTPFVYVDASWLHYYRLFLCSMHAPVETLDLRHIMMHLTNLKAANAIRMHSTAVTLRNPKKRQRRISSVSLSRSPLKDWGLNETGLLTEMLMSCGSIRTISIDGSSRSKTGTGTSPFLHHLGAIIR
jgi:hypothetical protein